MGGGVVSITNRCTITHSATIVGQIIKTTAHLECNVEEEQQGRQNGKLMDRQAALKGTVLDNLNDRPQ